MKDFSSICITFPVLCGKSLHMRNFLKMFVKKISLFFIPFSINILKYTGICVLFGLKLSISALMAGN